MPVHKLLAKFENKNAIYFLLVFLWQLARTLPHSIVIIFLISKFSLTSSDILLFQVMYFAPIFFLEIISGFLSDIFSRKKIYLASLAAIIIGYGLIGFGPLVAIVFIGQFFYGISIALFSGTLDAMFLNRIKKMQNEALVEHFLANSNIFALIGMFFGGTLGSFIFTGISNFIYLISIIIFTFVVIICLFLIKEPKRDYQFVLKSELKIVRTSTKELFKNKKFLNAFFLLASATVFFSPIFYNLWPSLFAENGIDIIFFGLFYGFFQVLAIIGSYAYKKTRQKYKAYVAWISIIIFLIIFGVSINFLRGVAFAVVIPIGMMFFEYYQLHKNNIIQKEISQRNTGTQFSLISTFFNLLSVFALVISSVLLRFVSDYDLLNIVLLLGVVLTLGNIFWNMVVVKIYKKKHHTKHLNPSVNE